MADTRVQVEVERWVREHALPQRFHQAFTQRSETLTWGGRFVVDAASDDGQIVACVSTAACKTATGRPAIGKYHKIRADALFLLHVPVLRRLLVFTDEAMYEHFQRDQRRGRFPDAKALELLHFAVPDHLRNRLTLSRDLASQEVRPSPQQEEANSSVEHARLNDTTPIEGVEGSPHANERDQIASFLQARRGHGYCDDCLASLMGLRRRQNAQRVTSHLATASGYRREHGHCSQCDTHATGREKYVIRAT